MNKVKQLIEAIRLSYDEQSIEHILRLCSKKTCVTFALNCAKEALENINQKESHKAYSNNKAALELAEKWLVNPTSVSRKELEEVAYETSNAASYAIYAIKSEHVANSSFYAAIAAYFAASSQPKKWKEYKQAAIKLAIKELKLDNSMLEILYG